MEYLRAFLCGGLLCLLGQLLLDKTNLTPARILVCYVICGIILEGMGLYESFSDWGGAGASLPLTGFGSLLARGVRRAVASDGLPGALYGGARAAAGGISAAISAAFLAGLLTRSKPKH